MRLRAESCRPTRREACQEHAAQIHCEGRDGYRAGGVPPRPRVARAVVVARGSSAGAG